MKEYERCLRCGRKLKKLEYRLIGFGKTCYEKNGKEKKLKTLFDPGGYNNEKQD